MSDRLCYCCGWSIVTGTCGWCRNAHCGATACLQEALTRERGQRRAVEQRCNLVEAGTAERIRALQEDNVRLRDRLERDVYPFVAGRVVNLQEAWEEYAADQWNRLAQRIRETLDGRERGE